MICESVLLFASVMIAGGSAGRCPETAVIKTDRSPVFLEAPCRSDSRVEGRMEPVTPIEGVRVSEGLVLVACGYSGVWVIDLTTTRGPELVAVIAALDRASGVAVTDGDLVRIGLKQLLDQYMLLQSHKE